MGPGYRVAVSALTVGYSGGKRSQTRRESSSGG